VKVNNAQSGEGTGWVYVSEHSEMSSGSTAPSSTCSAAAKRMRYHRERRREGFRCVTIELRETEIDELIRRKLLQADARNVVHGIRNAFEERPE
jgi:hypothetical protein